MFLLQHGLYNDNTGFFEYNKNVGVIPEKSDYYLSWGRVSTNYLLTNQINTKKIHTIGNPVHDRLQNLSPIKKRPYILLAVTSPTLQRISGHKIESVQFYYESVMKICKEIISLKQNSLHV